MHGITNECTHVRTAATINDHKTAHKHSSLAQFQTYDNTKKRSASGRLRPLTPWPGALPLDPAGGTAPRPRLQARAPRSRSPYGPLQSLLLHPPLVCVHVSECVCEFNVARRCVQGHMIDSIEKAIVHGEAVKATKPARVTHHAAVRPVSCLLVRRL